MADKNKIIRPKWLRFLLGLLSAWTSFVLTIVLIFVIVWIFQVKIFDSEISALPASILLVIAMVTSIYIAFRITRWQSNYMNNKSLKLNYITLIILLLLAFLFIPIPFTYMIY